MNDNGYQQRVRTEYEELLVKLDKLNLFIRSTSFLKITDIEKDLLLEQQECMNQYANTLLKRICIFTNSSI